MANPNFWLLLKSGERESDPQPPCSHSDNQGDGSAAGLEVAPPVGHSLHALYCLPDSSAVADDEVMLSDVSVLGP